MRTTAEIYKNAPLIEALCDIRFSQDKEWDWTIPGVIYNSIKDEFPIKRQEKAIGIIIDGKSGKSSSQDVGIDKMRFLRKDENALIQVGPHLLAVNQLIPYPGWNKFKEFIISSLEVYKNAAEPTGIDRIGLRYINRFSSEDIETDMSDNFHIKPSIPVGRPILDFFMRSQIYYEDLDSTCVITIANQQENNNVKKSSIILDFDFYSTNKQFISFENCLNWIEKAHGYIEEAFLSCISDKMKSRLMRGE